MHAGPGRDQQLGKAEMLTFIGFDCASIDVDPAHSRSQMDFDIALPVKRLIMD
jgi:hypothetical protein